MTIGIDVSQLAFENTGVANLLRGLVENLIKQDTANQYVFFYSSLRRPIQKLKFKIQNLNSKVKIKEYRLPPTLLDLLWNKLHILPIEKFIGDVDVFITSDWTEPPVRSAKKATILYDLMVYKYPEESHHQTNINPLKMIISPNIVEVQKRKLDWVKKETDKIFCISKSTADDAAKILGINKNKLVVLYPGI